MVIYMPLDNKFYIASLVKTDKYQTLELRILYQLFCLYAVRLIATFMVHEDIIPVPETFKWK